MVSVNKMDLCSCKQIHSHLKEMYENDFSEMAIEAYEDVLQITKEKCTFRSKKVDELTHCNLEILDLKECESKKKQLLDTIEKIENLQEKAISISEYFTGGINSLSTQLTNSKCHTIEKNLINFWKSDLSKDQSKIRLFVKKLDRENERLQKTVEQIDSRLCFNKSRSFDKGLSFPRKRAFSCGDIPIVF